MNIEEFVSSALTQIISGIKTAQQATKETGAIINPNVILGDRTPKDSLTVTTMRHGPQLAQIISFNLAVSVQESTQTGGGGKIKVLGLSAGGGMGIEASSASQSKVTFSIPIVWPIVGDQ
ncbi:hypothetical protein M7784_16310 [Desulfovibrio aminophilus]|nr:hypothetical protein [Desulfovibrio aminophilus]MCM0756798.1 hypothetical protein [Desulfovibrio aminophilus]